MIFNKDLKDLLFFPCKECFTHLKEYLKLGIPSTLMLSLEFWAFEIITLMSGYLSVDEVGANVIVLNTIYMCFMLIVGF
jgi:MATE family multidrug resistance protein